MTSNSNLVPIKWCEYCMLIRALQTRGAYPPLCPDRSPSAASQSYWFWWLGGRHSQLLSSICQLK